MDIIESNKLIAEFMGGEYVEDTTPYKIHYYRFEVCPIAHIVGKWSAPIEDLFYDCKWDWLMPVLDKMLGMYTTKEIIDYWNGKPCTNIIIFRESIEVTYYETVQFIKWYNNQPKK